MERFGRDEHRHRARGLVRVRWMEEGRKKASVHSKQMTSPAIRSNRSHDAVVPIILSPLPLGKWGRRMLEAQTLINVFLLHYWL